MKNMEKEKKKGIKQQKRKANKRTPFIA